MNITMQKVYLLKLADDLERFFKGEITLEQFRAQHNLANSMNETTTELVTHIEQYLVDADVRMEDAAYAEMQEAELVKLIGWLRSGNLTRALEVDFLAATADA